MKYILGIGLGITLLFVSASSALALTISPVKIEVTGDAGRTLAGEIELLNEQKEEKVFYPSYENFEPSGETGSPYFVGAKDGLATWMKTESNVVLAPGERRQIPFTITIPAGTEPGGYFAAIFWGGQDPKTQEGGEVSIGGRLGVLIFLRVAGDIEEGGGVLDFSALGGRIFSQLPITFSYRVNNTGADRIVPLGDLTITNSFRSTVETIPANISEGSILPDSARKFESVWSDDGEMAKGFFNTAMRQLRSFHFGWYTANLDLVWGSENEKVHAAYQFFIVPWQLLLIVLALLVIGWFLVRRYNAWIIARSAKPH